MFLLAFCLFLPIGEFTVASTKATNHCLKLSSIYETREGFVISFDSFKHSTPGEDSISKIAIQFLDHSFLMP